MTKIPYSTAIAILAFGLMSHSALTAPIETTIHSFTGNTNGPDGTLPSGGLVADSHGNLYGTTQQGGNVHNGGTVFKLTKDGGETILYSFCQKPNCVDGLDPHTNVILDDQGALYGTTSAGGDSDDGTIFKLTPPTRGTTVWTETVLHSFIGLPFGPGNDGAIPTSLIKGDNGTFYGATADGGVGNNSNGTVFKLTPPKNGQVTWNVTILYSFCTQTPPTPSCSDGARPSSLIVNKDGVIFGTTTVAGSGFGTIFKLTPNGKAGWTGTGIYSFKGGSDGATPQSLTIDNKDNIYGTTLSGGKGDNGVIFKFTPKGIETVIYSFCSQPSCNDGSQPAPGLIIGNSGTIYGATNSGGTGNNGTVFKLIPPINVMSNWSETVLYRFSGLDGANPAAGLTVNQGAFFGTTANGGTANNGTVFKLNAN
jgi:uncharacterized repeat protein (TIGR03803 family)